jgi:DNA-binding transcriptional ArsR family regulator
VIEGNNAEDHMQPTLEKEVNQLHSQLCAALADPKRILILYALTEGAMSVTEIGHTLNAPQPTVSRHLKTLRDRGLVEANRDAQSVYYNLSDHRVIEALDILRVVLADMLETQSNLAQSVSNLVSSDSASQEKKA